MWYLFQIYQGVCQRGDTIEEAMHNAEDAKRTWIEATIEAGIKINESDDSAYVG